MELPFGLIGNLFFGVPENDGCLLHNAQFYKWKSYVHFSKNWKCELFSKSSFFPIVDRFNVSFYVSSMGKTKRLLRPWNEFQNFLNLLILPKCRL